MGLLTSAAKRDLFPKSFVPPLENGDRLTRAEFERWIAEELQAIEQCVDGLLARCGVDARSVDRVFLTGGTSFVPAVRRIFETRFTAERVRSGNEFTSVASGLALRAQEMQR